MYGSVFRSFIVCRLLSSVVDWPIGVSAVPTPVLVFPIYSYKYSIQRSACAVFVLC